MEFQKGQYVESKIIGMSKRRQCDCFPPPIFPGSETMNNTYLKSFWCCSFICNDRLWLVASKPDQPRAAHSPSQLPACPHVLGAS